MQEPSDGGTVTRSTEVGRWYACSTCGMELLVARASAGPLTCCNHEMHLRGENVSDNGAVTLAPGDDCRGQRFRCSVCGGRALCTKTGSCLPECCGVAMEVESVVRPPSAGY